MAKQTPPRPNNYSKLFFAPYDPQPVDGMFPYRGAAEIPDDLDWESLDRMCPVLPVKPPFNELLTPTQVEEIRLTLRRGVHPADEEQGWLFNIGRVVIDSLDLRAVTGGDAVAAPAGWLYVLEVQGPFQYVKFGRGRDPLNRLINHHREAERHGFGILNAWVSPLLPDAVHAEGVALDLADGLQNAQHKGERFYDMPFPKALAVARVAAQTALLAKKDVVEAG